MTNKSLNYLLETSTRELVWRKKELSNIYLLCEKDNECEYTKGVLLKSFILLLYSHWEGYVKNLSIEYLRYINSRKLLNKFLSENFHAISMKSLIQKCVESKSTITLGNEISFMTEHSFLMDRKFNISISPDKKDIINTASNLNLEVFRGIHKVIGLHCKSSLEIVKGFIDHELLWKRNQISHGGVSSQDTLDLSIEKVKILRDSILLLLSYFREEIEVYASNSYFLIRNRDNKNMFDEEQEIRFSADIANRLKLCKDIK